MWRPPQSHFEVERPIPAPVRSAWSLPPAPVEQPKPDWHSDSDKKIAFGTRLGKGDKPLDAALFVFDNRMADGLWVVSHWLRDPLVIETRESVENNAKLLDKDQLCAKLLRIADEKTVQGYPAHEAKDRAALLKLYAEIQGYVGKVNIDASQKTFNNNSMQIVLVEAEPEKTEEARAIEHVELKPLDNALEIDLKLVG